MSSEAHCAYPANARPPILSLARPPTQAAAAEERTKGDHRSPSRVRQSLVDTRSCNVLPSGIVT